MTNEIIYKITPSLPSERKAIKPKDQYTTIPFNQSNKMTVDSMNVVAGVTTAKAIKAMGKVLGRSDILSI